MKKANQKKYGGDGGVIRPLALRPSDVEIMLGSEGLVRRMVRAGWLVPVISGKRLTLYDHDDVIRAWERIKAGEMPPIRDKGGAVDE